MVFLGYSTEHSRSGFHPDGAYILILLGEVNDAVYNTVMNATKINQVEEGDRKC